MLRVQSTPLVLQSTSRRRPSGRVKLPKVSDRKYQRCCRVASINGAAEHVAAAQIILPFCNWLQKLLDCVERHRRKPATIKAQRNSGIWHGRRGRSGLDRKGRDARDAWFAAKRDFVMALAVEREVSDRAYWDRCWEYGPWKAQDASEHLQWWNWRRWPRRYGHLTPWERMQLDRLHSGELRDTLKRARERHGGEVTAKRFRMSKPQ